MGWNRSTGRPCLMDISNFSEVIYATDGSKAAREWQQAFTDMIPKEADAAG